MPYAGKLYPGPRPGTRLLAIAEPDAEGLVECLEVPTGQDAPNDPEALSAAPRSHLPSSGLMDGEPLDAQDFDSLLRALARREFRRYYQSAHAPAKERPFRPGEDFVNYAGRVFDAAEMEAMCEAGLDFFLTSSRFDRAFCEALARALNTGAQDPVKVLSVNSGSSANLLAVSSLLSKKLGDDALVPGDEVITTAACFPTTLAPIVQNGLTPVFVDVELGTYNIDPARLEDAVGERTRAIFFAHALGTPADMDAVLALAEKHHLWVIEDSCDALGSRYDLARDYELIRGTRRAGDSVCGVMGHVGSMSFYPAHHITTGEGGAVCAADPTLRRVLYSVRDWGRDCWCESGQDGACGRRFSKKLGTLPEGYDHKYIYSHLGYNLKLTDPMAAVGLAQCDKLPAFVEARRANWRTLYEGMRDLDDLFILPRHPERATASPFGFPLTVRPGAPFNARELTMHLEERKVQTRLYFAGNILRQPAMIDYAHPHRVAGPLDNTDAVMERTFWLGVYPGYKPGMVDYILDTLRAFVKGR